MEGFVNTNFGYCLYSMEDPPTVYNLYVYPPYRKLGNSKRLLEYVINEIRQQGYTGKIYIEAVPREDSIGLEELTDYYERMGLTIWNEEKQND